MNRRTALDIANPVNPRGGGPLIHVLLIAVALLIAFLAGAFTGERVTASFYRTHFTAPLPVPKDRTRITVKVGSLPAAAGIYFRFLNTQNDDQGPLGSCQAWAAAKELSYGFNEIYPYHYRLYSPRYLYDAVSAGQDNGSYLEQYPPVVLAHGIAPWSTFPYGASALNLGYPGYAVESGVPSSIQSIAAAHHLSISEQYLYGNPGAGMGGVALIKQQLAAHQPVNLDLQVFPEYDRANADGSTVVPPVPGEVSRGGHANMAVYFDDGHRNPDGTSGAILASNQWSKEAGVGRDGIRHSTATNGFVWLSYGFVAQDTWGAAVLHVGSSSGVTAAQGVYIPSQAPLHQAPRITHHNTLAPKAGQVPQVYGVRTADTGVDLSAAINQSAAYYGFSAPGFAALMGVESGIRQYAPHYPINGAGFCDYSAGLTQITVCTAAGLGVGDGSTSQANINYVFSYEQADSVRDIWMSARLVARMKHNTCFDFKILYSAWNQGDGLGCGASAYPYPSNYITINAVASYNGWWNLIWAQNVTYNRPPPPRPTPKPIHHNAHHYSRASWCRSDRALHLRCPSAFYGHHLSTIAFEFFHWQHAFGGKRSLNSVAGGVIGAEHWNDKAKVMHQRFAHAWAYEWSQERGAPTKWVHARTWHKGMKT